MPVDALWPRAVLIVSEFSETLEPEAGKVTQLLERWKAELAALARKPKTCAFLLQSGAKADQTDKLFWSPTDIFIREGLTDGTKELLKSFSLSVEDAAEYLQMRKLTPLHQAIMGLREADLDSMLDLSSADVNTQDSVGRTPIYWAVSRANLQATRSLLRAGARLDVRDHKQQTPIHHCAVVRKENSGSLELLLTVAAQNEYREKARTRCSTHMEVKTAGKSFEEIHWRSKLMDDNKEYQGRTPLPLATNSDCVEKVRILLYHGANIEIADSQGKTALFNAIKHGSPKSALLLLDHNARADTVTNHGCTILHHAAQHADLRCLEVLLRARLTGINIDAKDNDGNTAAWTFKHLWPVVPTVEEQRAFDLLVASVKPTQPQEHSSRSLLEEDDSDIEIQKFFSAAASLEASLENSLENSIGDLKSTPGRGPTMGNWIFRAPKISPWIGSLGGKEMNLLDPADFYKITSPPPLSPDNFQFGLGGFSVRGCGKKYAWCQYGGMIMTR
ncbi:uncharacterized protein PAC_15707 [Phialocephala subalpina]|uniref:Uncharacterized protein n=1 Tax=Phialocephala subalpina TaxID=576137 RepID=A0A1L7XLJ0_9HELO|nr:uncharacterized protein PAC_15707 [Phialocephala subalpina]